MPPTTSFSPAPPPNLVIQCSGCKTIVGDTASNACAATIGATKILATRAASDVTVDRIPQKDTIESQTYTYFHVCCSGCGSVIGRMYTDAPVEAATMLNMFAFDISKCSSYRLGSADIRVSGDNNTTIAAAPLGGVGAEAEAAGAPTATAAGAGDLLARIESLETELLKMQGMILLHDGQLQTLPGYPVAAEGAML